MNSIHELYDKNCSTHSFISLGMNFNVDWHMSGTIWCTYIRVNELQPSRNFGVGTGLGRRWDFGVGSGFAPVAERVVAPEPMHSLRFRTEIPKFREEYYTGWKIFLFLFAHLNYLQKNTFKIIFSPSKPLHFWSL